MGYNIIIGQAKLRFYSDDLSLSIWAEKTTHDDAPDHCPYTQKGNMRMPSYSGWSSFCKEAGPEVYDLFYGEHGDARGERQCSYGFHRDRPLLYEHPGVEPLCQKDLDLIRAARVRREATNGGRPPGFWDDHGNRDNGNDHVLARFPWLEFWTDWALTNCDIPVLANS